MRRSRPIGPWPALALDALRLGLEAQQVMALRLWAMATGSPRGRRERGRMVTEKAGAFAEAAMAAGMAALLGGSTPVAIRSGMRKLRRRVRANRSRLTR